MPFWLATGCWAALRSSGCFFRLIRLAWPCKNGQKIVEVFLDLQTLNPQTVLRSQDLAKPRIGFLLKKIFFYWFGLVFEIKKPNQSVFSVFLVYNQKN